ncbi:MAG: hypothetical protein J0I42_20230 [Bosea sp.]|uniref:hypothetical protein n=1 Tax=Bosea sp. (in: a-proteobacteria) TaxID=1871050 RepID=UPI001AC4622B|nr:hypothetical protein [Bosea sp. (in: a-proteobacteria)]MBN9454271.1 hypothetical protein [Bosea sp. (in: a-proteobacteria)]
MANKVTDPALLRALESPDTPSLPIETSGRKVTDPALLAELEGAAPAAPAQMVPEYDAMGNPTGGMVAAPAPVTMGYGEQMGKIGSLVDKGVRMAANGLTFGMADRFAGGMDALTGQAPSYSSGVDAQHVRTQAIRDEAPILAGIAEAAGGLTGGVGLIKNGVTLAGRVGSGLMPRIAAFGAEGGLYGAAAGAGNTYTGNAQDYVDNGWSGAKTGALIGGALPAVGSASSSVYKIARALAGQNVEGVGRAGSAALRAAASADEAGLRNLPNLGAEAMLPDAGPSMLGIAQGAATGNGPGKTALVNALRERDAGTAGRLASVVDDALGPAPIPSQVDAAIRANQRALSPVYNEAFRDARAVDTRPIAEHIEALIPDSRGPVRSALEQVRSDLNIPGNPANLEVNPRALLSVRQSIDDALESAPRNVQSALGDIRRRIDTELTAKIPGIKAADAQYAELARQREALEMGQTIFDTGRGTVIRPIELAETLRNGGLPQGQMVGPSAAPVMVRQGARAELDRVVGTNINDLNALERTFATPRDWNNVKSRLTWGDDAVDRVTDALRTNRTFRDSMQRIVDGSRTAPTSAAAKSLEAGDGPRTDMTMTGLASAGVRAVSRALMGASSQTTKDQVARLMANPAYERIATALLEGAQRTNERAAALSRALSQPAYLGASSPASGRR